MVRPNTMIIAKDARIIMTTASSELRIPRNRYASSCDPFVSFAMSSYNLTIIPPMNMQTNSIWQPAAMPKSSRLLYGLQARIATCRTESVPQAQDAIM
eukprot:4472815-Prymnesium_polylepis.1